MQSIGLMMFIGDVHLAHGSSMTVEAACLHYQLLMVMVNGSESPLEVLAQGLERCVEICAQRGIDIPRELLLWAPGFANLANASWHLCTRVCSPRLTIPPGRTKILVSLHI